MSWPKPAGPRIEAWRGALSGQSKVEMSQTAGGWGTVPR
jgi:hypothetical protein